MSPAQKFFPTYFRPRNQYEIASGLCSVLIVLCALIGHMAFQLFPQGIFSAMIYTIPLGIIPGILAIFIAECSLRGFGNYARPFFP